MERVDGATVLVTGAAGFIGAALSQRLLQRGDRVVGLDNLNDYYDPSLEAGEAASDRSRGTRRSLALCGNGSGGRRCPDGVVCC